MRWVFLTPYNFVLSCLIALMGDAAFPTFWAEAVRSLSVIIAATAVVIFYTDPEEYFGNIDRFMGQAGGDSALGLFWPRNRKISFGLILAGEIMAHWAPVFVNGAPLVFRCLQLTSGLQPPAVCSANVAAAGVGPFLVASALSTGWFFALRQRILKAYGTVASKRTQLVYGWLACKIFFSVSLTYYSLFGHAIVLVN